MKKTILKSFVSGLIFIFTIIGVLYLVKAWNATDPNDLQSTPGDKLTSLKFNGLFARTKANYVKSVFTAGDVNISTATPTDMGTTLNLTTNANPVKVVIHGMYRNNGATPDTFMCFATIDGVSQRQKGGFYGQALVAGRTSTLHIEFISDVLTAGSHTFGLKCYDGGASYSFRLYKNTGTPVYYEVSEVRQN